MHTDQDLRHRKGQEFAKKNAPRSHCVILSFSPIDTSYIVDYTCFGYLKKVFEQVPIEGCAASTSVKKIGNARALCAYRCEGLSRRR